MKILYINPGRIESGLDSMIKGAPLNLITIAAMVPEHDAKLLDFKVDKIHEKNFRNELNRQDVVAITSLTPQIYHALEVAQIAKEQGCITILGGYHPTLDPQYVIEHSAVDYVIRGEGENTFKEIIEYLNGNNSQKSINDIDGVSYKDKSGEIHHNRERNLECNLDNFPLPRRDLLEGKPYTHMGTKMDNIETSRGCPYNCKFCCIVKMWKDSNQNISYRTKSIPRIMRELYDINRRNDFIFFCEDNFTVSVKRTKHVLDAMIKSGINNEFHFSCQSRVDTLYRNQWLIDLLKKAGFKQIFLGIESIHQQSLNAMNKRNTTPKMVKEVVQLLRNKGISIFGGLIIGFPGETKTMVRQNIQFAKSLNIDFVQFTPITAFPGTPFYEEMKINNMITSYNYKHYNLFYPMMGTEQLTNIEIYQLVAEAYAYFYLGMDWIKRRAKEYLNPFGKFNWMFKNMVGLIGQGLKEGAGMLLNNGITRKAISNELKQIKTQKNLIDKIIYSSQKLILKVNP
jgi:anaerobic magnesium-protoporphyrin IX monomethyl ester cyclase